MISPSFKDMFFFFVFYFNKTKPRKLVYSGRHLLAEGSPTMFEFDGIKSLPDCQSKFFGFCLSLTTGSTEDTIIKFPLSKYFERCSPLQMDCC